MPDVQVIENPYDSPTQSKTANNRPRSFRPYVIASCWVVVVWLVSIAALCVGQVLTVADGAVGVEFVEWDDTGGTYHHIYMDIAGAGVLLAIAVAVSLFVVNIVMGVWRWVLVR